MNTPWQAVWLLAVEVAGVVVVTGLIARRLRSVVWQRTLWQASLLALAGLLLVEFSSLNLFRASEGQPAPAALLAVPNLALSTPAVTPIENSPTAPAVEQTQPIVTASPEPFILPDVAPMPSPKELAPVDIQVEAMAVQAELPKDSFPLALALVLGVWAIGALVLASRLLVGRFILLRFCARSQSVFDVGLFERVQGIARKLGLKQSVQVLEASRIHTPVVFGLFQLTIALPAGFTERFDRRQQEAILAHELAHLAARDPLWYLLADGLVSVLWWHPLMWLARSRLQVTSEMAADEACVLAENGPETLAECLVTIAQEISTPGSLESIGIEGSGFRSRLGQRVERLLNLSAGLAQRPSAWRTRLVKLGLPVVLIGVLLLSSGWMRRDQATPWSGLLGGAWNMMAGMLQAAEPEPSVKRDPRPQLAATPAPVVVPEVKVVKVASKLSGQVFFYGILPAEKEVKISPSAAKFRAERLMTRNFITSSNHGLADTLIYVKKGLEGKKFEHPKTPVILKSKGFEWYPYIAAVQTGQPVSFITEDPLLYNLHFIPKNGSNVEWNRAMLPDAKKIEAVIDHPEVMAMLKCDSLPWMYAYLSVFEHPYFAVTDKEGGFEFPQELPPGRYTLVALHRRAGEQEMEIEVTNAAAKPVQFRLPVNGAAIQVAKLSEAANKKLDEIVMPELFMDGLPLGVAVKFLTEESKRFDPEKEGFKFELRGMVPGQFEVKPGAPLDPLGNPILTPVGGAKKSLEDVIVLVNPVKKGLKFRQVLETICEGADEPLQFSVQNGVVVISAKPKPIKGASPARKSQSDVDKATSQTNQVQVLPVTNSVVQTNSAKQKIPEKQRISQMLDRMVIKEPLDKEKPLFEVIRILHEESVKQDPDKIGIVFTIDPALDDKSAADLAGVLKSINPPRKNSTFSDVLQSIPRVAEPIESKRLTITIEDRGVVFSCIPLLTQKFEVNPVIFIADMERFTNRKIDSFTNVIGRWNGGPAGEEFMRQLRAQALTRLFAEKLGVKVSGLAYDGVNINFNFNSSVGYLRVRGSLEELATIQDGVKKIGSRLKEVEVNNAPVRRSQLDTIKVPKMKLDRVPLIEVVRILTEATRVPGRTNQLVVFRIEGAVTTSAGPVDLGLVNTIVDIEAGSSLREALELVCAGAGLSVRYVAQEGEVVFGLGEGFMEQPRMVSRINGIFSGPKRAALIQRLNTRVLPEVGFTNTTLREASKHLANLVNQGGDVLEPVTFGFREYVGVGEKAMLQPGLLDLKITIDPPLVNKTVYEVMQAMADSTPREAGRGLDFEIYNGDVVWQWNDDRSGSPQMFVRRFRVSPKTFEKGLKNAAAASGLTNIMTSTNIQEMSREFFRHVGLQMTTNTATSTQIFFNDATSVLTIRGTLSDLGVAQQTIEVLNMLPFE